MTIEARLVHELIDRHVAEVNILLRETAAAIIPSGNEIAGGALKAFTNPLSLILSRGPVGRVAAASLKHEFFGKALISKSDAIWALAEQSEYSKMDELKKALEIMKGFEELYKNTWSRAAQFSPF